MIEPKPPELDSAQHTYGPGSPEALEAMALMDRYVGELVEVARKAPGGATKTTVAIVSDHGFLPLTTQLQPNAALKEAGLIDVGPTGAVTGWRAWSHSSGGSAYVYVKDAADRPRVAVLLETLRKDPANGIRASKGGHGFAPDRKALHASLILAGPTVTRRGSVGIVRLTQVAPTLAGVFSVTLDPQAAAPIPLAGAR